MKKEFNEIGLMGFMTPYLGVKYSFLLFKFGYKTMEDLACAKISELKSIAGIGEGRAKIIERAVEVYNSEQHKETGSPKVIQLEFGAK